MPQWLAPVFEKSSYFMPHGHCYLWIPALLWLHVISDFLIGLAYVGISQILWLLVQRLRLPFSPVFVAFGLFIGLCGLTHFMEIWTVWNPDYWLEGLLKGATAAASVATAAGLYFIRPQIEAVVHAARLSEERRIRLESANAELEALNARISQLDAQKSEFFANVSHELRTPLALILGPAHQLLESGAGTPTERRRLEGIVRNAQLLLKHVNDLLDVSKLEAGRTVPQLTAIDLAHLVRLTAGQFELAAEQRNVTLEVTGPDHLSMQADPDMLSRVIVNLLANALKFTPAGGTVRVSLAAAPDQVRLCVEDSGPGVPSAQRELIFERFRQADAGAARHYGGTGLGLAIARDFVGLHDGVIGVDDSRLGGARFTVTLPGETQGADFPAQPPPVALPAEQTAIAAVLEELGVGALTLEGDTEAEQRVAAGGDGMRPRILVVEDNPEMRDFVAGLLGDEHSVITAASGAEGLASALAWCPDLIVSDMMMPGMTGEQFVDALRAEPSLSTVPVLMLTAKADDDLKVRLLRRGVQDYIGKPFLPQELRARVANQLAVKRAGDTLRSELASLSVDLEQLAYEIAAKNRALQSAVDVAQAARQQAEQATEVKSYFLGMMSHELRTPISTIQMNLDLLQRESGRLDEDQRRRLTRLQVAVRQIATVLEGILEYARLSSQRIAARSEPVDMVAIASDLVRLHAELAPPQVSITLDPVASSPAVFYSDGQLVRVILDNLLSNAVKFTKEGSVRVTVTTRGDAHLVEVRDTGIGIPEADLARIFEPFEQLEPLRRKSIPGVGLGLALVREIVNTLGGRISVESTLGVGTVFTVELPSKPSEK